MAVFREKPYPGINFRVDLGSGDVESPDSGLLEVIFPEAHLQVHEYRNGNEKTNEARKIQSTSKYSHLILRRGVIGSLSWYDWWNAARNGDHETAERTIVIKLLDEQQQEIVLTWMFLRARPVNYYFSSLNALGSEPLIESLEIAFESLLME
jgi:phage tail-like protein